MNKSGKKARYRMVICVKNVDRQVKAETGDHIDNCVLYLSSLKKVQPKLHDNLTKICLVAKTEKYIL